MMPRCIRLSMVCWTIERSASRPRSRSSWIARASRWSYSLCRSRPASISTLSFSMVCTNRSTDTGFVIASSRDGSVLPPGRYREAPRAASVGSRERGSGEPAYDRAGRLDRVDSRDALARLPVIPCRAAVSERALELPGRPQRVHGAHEALGAATLEEPAGDWPGTGAHALHVRRADHRQRHAGDALGQDDVVG